ncbi:MAG: hypothetical protein M1838_004242 [Thelocarpon superellum]|nr:MAG: hypothetical protein M1838_004242 [Thelocarpon superellum]
MATPLDAIKSSLPPTTDPLTFLTILEYNLTPDLLPDLYQILQDPTLTSNIGWDLISLLTPLLPASRECLQEVARLGNPRECVLKATECLRQIDFEKVSGYEPLPSTDADPASAPAPASEPASKPLPEPESGLEPVTEAITEAATESTIEPTIEPTTKPITKPVPESGPDPTTEPATKPITEPVPEPASEANPEEDAEREEPPSAAKVTPSQTPLLTFTALLAVLSTLHPRIKSARPSRFLSSTLQALLATYTDATHHLPTSQVDEITSETIRFIKSVSGRKRPVLPPRRSTQDIKPSREAGPDPEAQDESPSAEELVLTERLLQSFVTHILEDYVLSLDVIMAWSARFEEKTRPERVISGRPKLSQKFATDSTLQEQESTIGQLVAVAQDLNLSNEDLIRSILGPFPEPSDDDGLPNQPSDIPLSKTGALFLLASRISSSVLFGSSVSLPTLSIFPEHAGLSKTFIGPNGVETIGSENEAVADAVIVLGRWAMYRGKLGEMSGVEEEDFTNYLQILSLLSANHPSPEIRYSAHVLCSSVLHAQPSDLTRLAFILDTLQHCPFENLRGSAVGWFKDETLTATSHVSEDGPVSVFATPVALETLAPYLYPDLGPVLETPPLTEAWFALKSSLSFHLAALNLHYLFLTASHLHALLKIPTLFRTHDIKASYLDPLQRSTDRFRESLASGAGPLLDEEGPEGVQMAVADLQLLQNVLARVWEKMNRQDVSE